MLSTVVTMCLCASVLGDIFGWQTQQDRWVVHDILPIKKHEKDQLGCGSREEFTWHTEDAFHELRGNYLIMMYLRSNDVIPSTLCKPDYSKLSQWQIDELFKKRFLIGSDNSRKTISSSASRRMSIERDSNPHLLRVYHSMVARNSKPQNIAVLFGNRDDPCLRLDPYSIEQPKRREDRESLKAMLELVGSSLIEVALKPGDILIVDNCEVGHGRRPFKARYDGADRWYKRYSRYWTL